MLIVVIRRRINVWSALRTKIARGLRRGRYVYRWFDDADVDCWAKAVRLRNSVKKAFVARLIAVRRFVDLRTRMAVAVTTRMPAAYVRIREHAIRGLVAIWGLNVIRRRALVTRGSDALSA